MKERPIIFSGPMVRAILDDRKVQTRRVIKPQPIGKYSGITGITTGFLESRPRYVWRDDKQEMTAWRRCPYGVPGDRLWVRETWRTRGYTGLPNADKFPEWHLDLEDWFYIHYRANNAIAPVSLPVRDALIYGKKYAGEKWRPSIFMPRWASRITLEITDVRVEQVRDISRDDAIAEGIGIKGLQKELGTNLIHAQDIFRALWDSLNAKRGFDWDVNPWVWAIEFRRVDD